MEHTYFTNKLASFLIEDHPDLIVSLAGDTENFIKSRADHASEIFESEIKSGISQDMALERAMNELYQGLYFSKYNTIEEIIEEYYPQKYSSFENANTRMEYIIMVVQKCEEVFSRYDLSIYSDKLTTELIGTIEELMGN